MTPFWQGFTVAFGLAVVLVPMATLLLARWFFRKIGLHICPEHPQLPELIRPPQAFPPPVKSGGAAR